jgi:hypothetical protein
MQPFWLRLFLMMSTPFLPCLAAGFDTPQSIVQILSLRERRCPASSKSGHRDARQE